MSAASSKPLKPKIVLCIAAHADDLEVGAGGSIINWIREGATVYYLILTNGNKGTSDPLLSPAQLRATRREEQQAAANLLGIKKVFFCDYNDGELEVSQALKRDIVRVIRTVRPDTVVTMDPTVVYVAERGIINHPDHRAAGQATLDAVFPLARDRLSFPELQKEQLDPHSTATVLLINFGTSNFTIDITNVFDDKMTTVYAHVSQFPDREGVKRFVHSLSWDAAKRAHHEHFMRIDVDSV